MGRQRLSVDHPLYRVCSSAWEELVQQAGTDKALQTVSSSPVAVLWRHLGMTERSAVSLDLQDHDSPQNKPQSPPAMGSGIGPASTERSAVCLPHEDSD